MKNILIINPFGIGDVLFSTPLISNLRRAYPQAKISFLANRRTEDIFRHDPRIHKTFVYERDEFVAVYKKNIFKFWAKWISLSSAIRHEHFDVTFDLSLNSTFGFLSLMSGIPRRIGYNYHVRGRFLTDPVPLEGYEGRHVVEYYLDLLNFLKIPVVDRQMNLHLPDADLQWAKQWLKAHQVDVQKPLIAIIPGGGASWGKEAKFKRWPADKYAYLVDKIIANLDAAVILLGDNKEEELCSSIAREVHYPLHSAVGETSILQMAALLKQCRLAIVNDGGPLHVAVASSVKTVSIFGPVDPDVYGPYPKAKHTVITKGLPCQPCYRRFRMAQCSHIRCLNDLSIEEVYNGVVWAMDESSVQ